MAKVLIVFHFQSGNTKAAAEAVAQGTKDTYPQHLSLFNSFGSGGIGMLNHTLLLAK